MKRRLWKVKQLSLKVKEIAAKKNMPAYLVQVLINRSIKPDDFNSFLNPDIKNLHSPFLLPDMERAVKRIEKAVSNKEKVLIFGDYDVDGVTSLAIFNHFAQKFPDVFSFYIPHRIKEGYGLNSEAILAAKEEGVSLLITFDCGSNAYVEVSLANSLNIDTIVVDHHTLGDQTLPAYAFINPQREESKYPFKYLSSGALSFKVLQALSGSEAYQALDLVVLSLVCDISPLIGENRLLLKEGLSLIKKSSRMAIKALCKVAKIKQANIDIFHIGYIIGPRINASGRVAHGQQSLDLFLSQDPKQVESLANQLGEYNILRRNIESQILKEAEQKIQDSLGSSNSIVVSGDGWHPGVLGIVASRLAVKYSRPSFVISFDKEKGVGSGRSVGGLHLIEILDKCADSLISYGGHKKAAGVHINRQGLEVFKEKINSIIEEDVKPKDFIPILDIDTEINFDDIDINLAEGIEMLKPYGEGNSKPLFVSYGLSKKSPIKKIRYGYSLWLTNGKKTFEGLVSSKDLVEILEYGSQLDIVFSLATNTYHNIPRLEIKDCRLADSLN